MCIQLFKIWNLFHPHMRTSLQSLQSAVTATYTLLPLQKKCYVAKVLYLSEWEERREEWLGWYPFQRKVIYMHNYAKGDRFHMLFKRARKINGRLVQFWGAYVTSWPTVSDFLQFYCFKSLSNLCTLSYPTLFFFCPAFPSLSKLISGTKFHELSIFIETVPLYSKLQCISLIFQMCQHIKRPTRKRQRCFFIWVSAS